MHGLTPTIEIEEMECVRKPYTSHTEGFAKRRSFEFRVFLLGYRAWEVSTRRRKLLALLSRLRAVRIAPDAGPDFMPHPASK
jgi:hypothetical protein